MKKAINIFIYIFGMAVLSASVTIIICLALAMNKKPVGRTSYEAYWDKFQNHNYLVHEDFVFAAWVGAAVAGFWILVNLMLVFMGGFDSNYYKSVQETIKIPFVRFFGILIFSGACGGALFFFMEYATATAKYPPKYDEWYQFGLVFAVLGILLYYFVKFIKWLFRKRQPVN
ncbi:MAG TPA: hypothetical protein VK177_10965 [Flavobacteriales bacterium]|nr:hypothetical protein [Flavobacteriales bacterium]